MIDKKKYYGFMPGCSLSSYNPAAVIKMTDYLNLVLPNFAAILKCCGKPTKDMGQYQLFLNRFAGFKQDMADVHIEELILACSSCKVTFDKESNIKTHSLWEILPFLGLPKVVRGKAKDSNLVFTIHDSCSARYDKGLQDGIRWILNELGYQYIESEYSREKTRCCGFGGMVAQANPEGAKRVMQRRIETLKTNPVVVYCGTCRSAMLQAGVKSWHILDLIWGPVIYAHDEPNPDVLKTPDAVWHNRYKTKKGIISVTEKVSL